MSKKLYEIIPPKRKKQIKNFLTFSKLKIRSSNILNDMWGGVIFTQKKWLITQGFLSFLYFVFVVRIWESIMKTVLDNLINNTDCVSAK